MPQHKTVKIADIDVANDNPLVLFAGINVLESAQLADEVAAHLISVSCELGLRFVFKASFDKAQRLVVSNA